MQQVLTQNDIDLIEQTVDQKIAKKLETSLDLGKGQALGGDFMLEIVMGVVLPILSSLASSGLYDLLKGAINKKSLTRRMIGSKIDVENPLTPECLQELKTQLMPLGFTEKEIMLIYEDVKTRLRDKENEQRKDG